MVARPMKPVAVVPESDPEEMANSDEDASEDSGWDFRDDFDV